MLNYFLCDDYTMLKKHLLKLTVFSCFLLGWAIISSAQNAPVTICGTVSGAIPGMVSVPVTVTGFTGIGAASLTLDYNYSVIQFLQGSPNPSLPGFLSGDLDLGNGFHRISMGWYGSSKTLPDGTTIMTLNFNYIGGNSALTWFDNGSSCEYADGMSNVLNDLPTASYYLNGYLCESIGNPGPVSGNNTVCQGQTGESYSVLPLTNVTGYAWTVPPGAAIVNGQNTNSILVDYSGNAVSGDISVCGLIPCGNGPLAHFPVTVIPLPYASAGNDTAIHYGTSTALHAASGGSGNFSYHWSPEALLVDPDVQNPQTVMLTTTTLFTLVVVNQASSSCQTSDDVIVTVTGGPLSMNPAAVPGNICNGDYSQLFSNAGGGSGNFTYLWSCIPPGNPPWSSTLENPVVSPDSSRLYHLSVSDGFTYVSGAVNLSVLQLPATPEISVIGYTLLSNVCCGNQWYLNNGAIPGATGQSITATASGLYSDIVTLNGCSSDTSEIVGVVVGISGTDKSIFSLSPNPADDIVQITYPGNLNNIKITVTSIDGRLMGRYDFIPSAENYESSIDISSYNPGLYLVAISSGNRRAVSKLMVN